MTLSNHYVYQAGHAIFGHPWDAREYARSRGFSVVRTTMAQADFEESKQMSGRWNKQTRSVRFDQQGRALVLDARLTRAGVYDRWGDDFAACWQAGLDPDRHYRVFYDPYELRAASAAFDAIPLTIGHDYHEWPVGMVHDASFDGDWLKADIEVWNRGAIGDARSGHRDQLSIGYNAIVDMSPGVWRGQRYDFAMRDWRPDHVALVSHGLMGMDASLSV